MLKLNFQRPIKRF